MKRLFPKAVLGFFLIAVGMSATLSWAATSVLLNANFNDKPLGMPIGTGGASVGEPIFVHPSIEAKVGAGLMPTPALDIKHLTGAGFSSVVFEFPSQTAVRDGDLRISFKVRASTALAAFQIWISEPGNSIHKFGELDFTALGAVDAADGTGPSPSVASFIPGSTVNVEYIYHMVARTYDLRINNVLVLENRPHGITAPGVGIGRLVFSTNHMATNQMQTWGLDDLFVTQSTLLLDADFNDKAVNSPIGTAGASQGEPRSVSASLNAIVRDTPLSTKSLNFKQVTPSASATARFDLVGGAQVRRGELHVGFTVRTPDEFDAFQVRMREPNATFSGFFGGVEFTSAGEIVAVNTPNGNEAFFDYAPNTTYRIELVYQVAAGTYDIYVDGKVRLGGAKHSVSDPELGFGAIDFSTKPNSVKEWVIDDLRVEHKPMLLDADFNLQPIDQMIGTGGAIAGQPVFIFAGLTALPQSALFFTPALRLSQANTGTAKPAHFEFIQSAKVTGGELRIGMRVLPMNSGDSFSITMSEQGSSVGTFGSLTFLSNGDVRSYDSGGSAVFTTHAAAVEQQFEFRYRFGAGQYDIYVDRVLALANRPIPAGINIGRITASTTATTSGRWIVDDLYAYRVNDSIFKTGFDCAGCE